MTLTLAWFMAILPIALFALLILYMTFVSIADRNWMALTVVGILVFVIVACIGAAWGWEILEAHYHWKR